MYNKSREEYSKEIKKREIMNYIINHGKDFDFMELAIHMDMTFGQLRKELNLLLVQEKLVIKDGILKVSIIYENMYKNDNKSVRECIEDLEIKENASSYIPKNFSSKFIGYN